LPNKDKKIGQLASRIERNGRRRSLRRPELSAVKEISVPGRRRSFQWRNSSVLKPCRIVMCDLWRRK
jgi:hypothetical protein